MISESSLPADPIERSKPAVWLASSFILAIMAAQSFISLALPPVYPKKVMATWPVINYPMYSDARQEGDPLRVRILVGEHHDGTLVDLSQERLPFGPWFYAIFASAIIRGESSVVNSFLAHAVFEQSDMQFKALHVFDRGSTFYIDRLVPYEETLLATVIIPDGATKEQ